MANNYLCETLEFMDRIRKQWNLERFSIRLDDVGFMCFIAETRYPTHLTSKVSITVTNFNASPLAIIKRTIEYQLLRDGFKPHKETR